MEMNEDIPPQNEGWKSFNTLPNINEEIIIWMYGRSWESSWKPGPIPQIMKAWKPK
jgi:hypothetical protein